MVKKSELEAPPPKILKEWHDDPLCQSAGRAMATLIEKGCERHLIEGYLLRIVGYPKRKGGTQIYRGPSGAKVARQLRACARQLRKVAERIEELRKLWGLWERLVDAECIHVPEELCNIAGSLSKVQTKGYAHWNPHHEAVLDLLDFVQSGTGRFHYAELSHLINAYYAYNALKHGRNLPDDLIYDVDSLKMIVSLQKQLARRKRRNR